MKIESREAWLQAVVDLARPVFERAGAVIPGRVRVSCGLPSVGGFRSTKRVIGEAWSSVASSDEHFEVFVSPTIDDPRQVVAVLLHELVHTAVGLGCGHRGRFPLVAGAVGLVGPWTSAKASEALDVSIGKWCARLGPYPHAKLAKMTNGKKKQSARLVKCWCAECGYTMRVTLKWILVAAPVCFNAECPQEGSAMEVGLEGGGEDERGYLGSSKVRPL